MLGSFGDEEGDFLQLLSYKFRQNKYCQIHSLANSKICFTSLMHFQVVLLFKDILNFSPKTFTA